MRRKVNRSGAVKVSVSPGYCASSLGDWCPAFRYSTVVPSSKVMSVSSLDISTFDYGTTLLFRNFGRKSSSDSSRQPRRMENSWNSPSNIMSVAFQLPLFLSQTSQRNLHIMLTFTSYAALYSALAVRRYCSRI